MTAWIQGPESKKQSAEPKSQISGVKVRLRGALWLVLAMLCLSMLLVVLGSYIVTRTDSLNVSGHVSGGILTLGSFLGLLGLLLEENRKKLLSASRTFFIFGIIASFLCLLFDSTTVALQMDMSPLRAGRCQYYSSGSSYIYENSYATVSCKDLRDSCTVTVRSGTCFCCDLYDCARGDYLENYYEFVGVRSCEDVFTLYVLIWTLAGLNFIALFTGISTTAVLDSIKDFNSSSPASEHIRNAASSPTAPRLMDDNLHTPGQLHSNGASVLFPPAETTFGSQGFLSSAASESIPAPLSAPTAPPH
ncbi:unnamed protein product [Menidia menidia]|uniref:(Atlantic silverside) hypothetical protein n=1 Tax=Menidia menidia TaxID=238744 RepID=A0A8S4BRS2_9TELE|nr:unnamed protein product [Menidia menidia]